jgi:hypothetical protein
VQYGKILMIAKGEKAKKLLASATKRFEGPKINRKCIKWKDTMEFMGGAYEWSCRPRIDAMALHQTPVIRQVHWWNKRILKPSKPSTEGGFELSKFGFFSQSPLACGGGKSLQIDTPLKSVKIIRYSRSLLFDITLF